jgi:hypothetical protein
MASYEFEPNVRCLFEEIKQNATSGLYNLFNPSFVKADPNQLELRTFVVRQEHEMRIDLIVKEMYDLEFAGPEIMRDVDVILYLNDIDNPLNITRGMILYYPEQGSLENYRVKAEILADTSYTKNSEKNKLFVPNKTTKKDSSREKFKNNGYSVPPTAQSNPRPPVSVSADGNFVLGGL